MNPRASKNSRKRCLTPDRMRKIAWLVDVRKSMTRLFSRVSSPIVASLSSSYSWMTPFSNTVIPKELTEAFSGAAGADAALI